MGDDVAVGSSGGDLDTVQEIERLVTAFYADVAQDDLLGPLFNDVARVDWSDHLPRLIAFWSRVLLGVHGYDGNPMLAHAEVHRRQPFTDAHFERWLGLFNEHVDLGWRGPIAERAKHLAANVARVHRSRLGAEEMQSGGRTASEVTLAQPRPRTRS